MYLWSHMHVGRLLTIAVPEFTYVYTHLHMYVRTYIRIYSLCCSVTIHKCTYICMYISTVHNYISTYVRTCCGCQSYTSTQHCHHMCIHNTSDFHMYICMCTALNQWSVNSHKHSSATERLRAEPLGSAVRDDLCASDVCL